MKKIIIGTILALSPLICSAQSDLFRIDTIRSYIRVGSINHITGNCGTIVNLDGKPALHAKCGNLDSMVITGDTIAIIKYLLKSIERQGNISGKAIDVLSLINVKWLTSTADISDTLWQRKLYKAYELYRHELYNN